MKCLIIAAGLGSRISTKGDSKPLIHLLGLPLIDLIMGKELLVNLITKTINLMPSLVRTCIEKN